MAKKNVQQLTGNSEKVNGSKRTRCGAGRAGNMARSGQTVQDDLPSMSAPPTESARVTKLAQAVQTGQPVRSTHLTHEEIADRAEALWRQRGCRAGEDEQNWRDAEAQLRHELAAS